MQVKLQNGGQVSAASQISPLQRINRTTRSAGYAAVGNRTQMVYVMKSASMDYVHSMRSKRGGNAFRNELKHSGTRDGANGILVSRLDGSIRELHSLEPEESGFISRYLNDLASVRQRFTGSSAYQAMKWQSELTGTATQGPLQKLEEAIASHTEAAYGEDGYSAPYDTAPEDAEAAPENTETKEAPSEQRDTPEDDPGLFQAGSPAFIMGGDE
ncbi:hypothetical protein LJC63_09590 [Ruminococcaceae bacterium OttesenSCG-928-L11]|nr:hypothetical protein [Ruminococcaceae bacterium OttesenSCG-928-L11]